MTNDRARVRVGTVATALAMAMLAAHAFAARADLRPPGVVAPLTGPQTGDPVELALAFVRAKAGDLGLETSDLDDALLVDSYRSRHNGVAHVYLRQRLDGIEVFNGDISVHVLADGSILKLNSLFAADLRAAANAAEPIFDAAAAVTAAAGHLDLTVAAPPAVVERTHGPDRAVTFAPSGVSRAPIPVRLMYFEVAPGDVRLAWNVRVYMADGQHSWEMLIDAATGAELNRVDWVAHDSYRVYELPAPSPNHVTPTPPADGRAVVIDPAEPMASPYGWHTTTTTPGQYDATRGNNVDAYEDQDDSDAPTGGDDARAVAPGLDFDFPIDLTQAPGSHLDASITNLFYLSNWVHDVLWHYGFDEASGNFQVNNYGRGGDGGDDVQAECQDGGGRNNGNFFTPPDGERPRMQIFLWDPPLPILRANAPTSVVGDYAVMPAVFGPRPPAAPGITGDLVWVDDGSATPRVGCAPLVNAGEVAGKIAIAELGGGCNAGVKVGHAEDAGAIALVVFPVDPRTILFPLPGSGSPTIPTVLINYTAAETLRVEVPGVNATLLDPVPGAPDFDGDLDAELVLHEYAHGLSSRLVGGRMNVSCLGGSEQAGEGWSDLFALMLTARSADFGAEERGVLTYVKGHPTDGLGIRGVPYSTDLTISPRTYGDIGDLLVPHESGSVWASAGWEVFWALVEQDGFDPDLVNGSGGNNLAIQLFVDGMKLGPCDPGFVDNRDAVLSADQALTGGANQCLLWRAFAKRGLGASAVQGSMDVGDETEAFDVPPECDCPAAVELGNVLQAVRSADDVVLEFSGAAGSEWRLFRDDDKAALRVTELPPDVTVTSFTDAGALDPAIGDRLFYRVTEVDCAGEAGP